MRNSFLRIMILFVLSGILTTVPAFAATRTVKLNIPDMCASNEIQAKAVLGEIKGVSSVETDLGDMTAIVTFDDEDTSTEAFKEALDGISLPVESIESVE